MQHKERKIVSQIGERKAEKAVNLTESREMAINADDQSESSSEYYYDEEDDDEEEIKEEAT